MEPNMKAVTMFCRPNSGILWPFTSSKLHCEVGRHDICLCCCVIKEKAQKEARLSVRDGGFYSENRSSSVFTAAFSGRQG